MDRSRVGRGLAILAVAALAVAVVSPAFSAAPLTKAKVKKISKKQINKLVPGLAIEESELDRFGPVNLSVGATQALGTWGPFSLVAECIDPVADADLDILGQVFVRTTEANSVFASLWDQGDFSPGDNEEVWAESFTTFDIDPGDPPEPASYDETSYAAAPSGTTIWGLVDPSVNLGGAHCTFAGFTLAVAPTA